MDKAINVSEDFLFSDGDLNECFESVIQNQGFLRKWISGESNKAEVLILLKIPGHTSVTKKSSFQKCLTFFLLKQTSFIMKLISKMNHTENTTSVASKKLLTKLDLKMD